jgi:hypothetical protein
VASSSLLPRCMPNAAPEQPERSLDTMSAYPASQIARSLDGAPATFMVGNFHGRGGASSSGLDRQIAAVRAAARKGSTVTPHGRRAAGAA